MRIQRGVKELVQYALIRRRRKVYNSKTDLTEELERFLRMAKKEKVEFTKTLRKK